MLAEHDRKLSDCRAMGVRDSPLPPSVQALMAEAELRPHGRGADIVDQVAMGVPFIKHGPLYQHIVDTASPISLIAAELAFAHHSRMGFGARLTDAIKAAGFRSARRFAIDGLGWQESSGPQRLSNYIKHDRIPDRETLAQIARAAKTSPEALLNEAGDDVLRDILLRLLELEGITPDRADTIATAFLAARRLHSAYPPDEGDPQTRARLAAHSAWQTLPPQAHDR